MYLAILLWHLNNLVFLYLHGVFVVELVVQSARYEKKTIVAVIDEGVSTF